MSLLRRLFRRPEVRASVSRRDGQWRVVVHVEGRPVRSTPHPSFAEALADAVSVTHRP